MTDENLALMLVRADCGSCFYSKDCGPDVESLSCSTCVLGTRGDLATYCHWRRDRPTEQQTKDAVAVLERKLDGMTKLANKMLKRNLELNAAMTKMLHGGGP